MVVNEVIIFHTLIIYVFWNVQNRKIFGWYGSSGKGLALSSSPSIDTIKKSINTE
jgi:hypothetical protein